VIFKRELPEAHEVESGSAKAGFDRVAKLIRVFDQAACIRDWIGVGEVRVSGQVGFVVPTEMADIIIVAIIP
jgi:hypothetical protein